MPPGGLRGLRTFTRDGEVLKQTVPPGTLKRIIVFGRAYSRQLALFLLVVVLDAAVGIVNPLLFRAIIDNGVLAGNARLVVELSLGVAGIAIADALFTFLQRGIAVRIGQDMLLDMRVQ